MAEIDSTKPVQGQTAFKGDLRGNLQVIKDRVEPSVGTDANAAITVDAALFGDRQYLRRLSASSGAVAVTLASDVGVGRVVELVRKGAGNISVAAGAGAVLVPAEEAGNWPTGLHVTSDVDEALIYTRDPDYAYQLAAAQSWDTNSPSYAVPSGPLRLLVVGVQQEGAPDITPDSVTVTYGGQAMTRRVFEHIDAAGGDLEVVLFTLGESGIAAAADDVIAVTGLAQAPNGFTIHAVAYGNVHQTTPVPETNSQEQPGGTAASVDIAAGDGAIVVALAGTGASAGDADWTASEVVELTDLDAIAGGGSAGSLAAVTAVGAQTITAACTWGSQPRGVIAAMEIAPAGAVWRQVSRPPVVA